MAFGALGNPFHHPLCHGLEEALHFSHAEAQKQIPNRVITGESVDSQQTM